MSTAGHHGEQGRPGLELSPFRGLRYAAERVRCLAAVTSPPYDVVVRPDGLHHLEALDPHNIVRLILPQALDPAERNARAAETLRGWLAEGVLTVEERPALYVYEQRGVDGLLQRGLIGALRLTDPAEGVVLPHEDVMPHVVADRAALMQATSANLEPLLLSYRGDGDVSGAAAVVEAAAGREPLLSTVSEDGVAHRLWAVTDPAEQAAAQEDLLGHRALIADGHHRWATYLLLRDSKRPSPGPWDHGLVLLVDSSRYPLRVRAIHRLLRRLPVPEALAALTGLFRVRRLDAALPEALEHLATAAGRGNAFLLAGDGAFHLVDRPDPDLLARTVPSGPPEAWRSLDATVLHRALLDDVWNVPEDSPEQITYIHDAEATVRQAEREGGTAVLLHPVREEVVRELAEQGVTMPRKSTSFGPKPASGLVLRLVGE
ncbi:DUF1015 family protein [Streptomyces abyssomicinicus]|uniref:DUF1015 family protein n=1 Tax=Streptomyces abyssomicinicus TaxID=574929 RepID=UPI001250155B|nr:DUF1015 domain-containing protein [Streptomyces abyssomicinicus]